MSEENWRFTASLSSYKHTLMALALLVRGELKIWSPWGKGAIQE